MRSKEIRTKRAEAFEQMKVVIDTAEGEDRDLTAEEREKYDAIETEFDSLTERLTRQEATETRERELAATIAETEDKNKETGSTEEQREAAYGEAFDAYLRRGLTFITTEQRNVLTQGVADLPKESRDLSKLTGGAGGFTVPKTFVKRLLAGLREEVTMRAIGAEQLTTTSGEDITFPRVATYGANAGITAELTAITFVDDSFDQVELGAYTYPTGTKISFQLLEDSAVDLERFLNDQIRERIARGQNNHFINGNGTTQPNGVVTAAAVGVTTAAGALTTFTADNIIDLYHSVRRMYRSRGKWLMDDAAVKVLRKLKDNDGQYIWQPGLQADEPDRILGKPVFTDADMPDPAASAKSVLFGDFSKYMIRDVSGIALRRLDERYADQLAVGFIGWMRSDGDLLDLNAIKALQHAAV